MNSRCCAKNDDGTACCAEASIPDAERGGLVCAAHAPKAGQQDRRSLSPVRMHPDDYSEWSREPGHGESWRRDYR